MRETLRQQEAADHAMRHWTFGDTTPIKLGSDAHKRMFCRMLLETHNPYKPAVIEWPKLARDALARVTSLPIWDITVQTEGAPRFAWPRTRRACAPKSAQEHL